AAVIQRRTDLEEAAGTAFVFGLVSSVALCGIGFFVAPFVADAFHEPKLTLVLRVLLLLLPLRGLGMVPSALIERELAFARRARGELGGAFVQAATAIPLAALGAGVWSLVAGQLAGTVVQSVLYYLYSPFRPAPRLATVSMLRQLGRYGRHVAAGNLIGIVDGNADNVAAGRLLGSAGL